MTVITRTYTDPYLRRLFSLFKYKFISHRNHKNNNKRGLNSHKIYISYQCDNSLVFILDYYMGV